MAGRELALSLAGLWEMLSLAIGSSGACGISPPLMWLMLRPGLASWYEHYLER
jgi:hypothetical protein